MGTSAAQASPATNRPPGVARDTCAERDEGQQVQRRSVTEAKRRHCSQLVADVRDRCLQSKRKQHDPNNHRQVQVCVRVARQGNARSAASVGEQLLRPNREEVEVRQPE
jgi:hypothetical protein